MITLDSICKTLNEALECDPMAMWFVRTFVTEVNQKLADHPAIQVSSPYFDSSKFIMRFIGLINGFSDDPNKFIAEVYDEPNEDGVRNLLRFEVITPEFRNENEN